jgi:hypothetical protein
MKELQDRYKGAVVYGNDLDVFITIRIEDEKINDCFAVHSFLMSASDVYAQETKFRQSSKKGLFCICTDMN